LFQWTIEGEGAGAEKVVGVASPLNNEEKRENVK